MLVSVLPDLYCINMYQYYFPEHRYSPCSCSNHSGRMHIMSMPPFLGLSSLFHSNYEIQASFSKYALLHPAHDIDGRCSWRWDGGKAGKANLNLILYMHEIFKNGLLQSRVYRMEPNECSSWQGILSIFMHLRLFHVYLGKSLSDAALQCWEWGMAPGFAS